MTKGWWLLCLVPAVGWAQSDHTNIESGHPLGFDDAYSIGYGERSFGFSRSLGPENDFHVGATYGFAKNQDFTIGYDTKGQELEVSYFRGLRREIEDQPGLAYRVSAHVPRNGSAIVTIRGIGTKHLGQYEKLHFNVDLLLASDVGIGVTLGYSSPIGLPRHFDTQFLAEVSGTVPKDQRSTVRFGVGLRHQVNPVTVADIGIQVSAEETRLKFGMSVAF